MTGSVDARYAIAKLLGITVPQFSLLERGEAILSDVLTCVFVLAGGWCTVPPRLSLCLVSYRLTAGLSLCLAGWLWAVVLRCIDSDREATMRVSSMCGTSADDATLLSLDASDADSDDEFPLAVGETSMSGGEEESKSSFRVSPTPQRIAQTTSLYVTFCG